MVFYLCRSLVRLQTLSDKPIISFELVLVGITAGALIGAIIGVLPGLAEDEKDTHLYTQGINVGDKVLVLHAPREDVEKAEKTSHQIGCRGVRVVPKFNESL